MAIAKLNKLKIIIHNSQKEELFRFLQEEGSVEIIDLKSVLSEDAYSVFLPHEDESSEIKTLKDSQQDLFWLIDFMALVNKTKRYTIKKSEFKNISETFKYQPLFKKAKTIESSLKELESSRNVSLEKKDKILPWQNLNVDLADICRVAHTIRGLAVIKESFFEKIEEELKRNNLNAYIEPVNKSGNTIFVLFIYIKEDEDKIEPIFKKNSIEHVYFPECKGIPRELLNFIEEELEKIHTKKKLLMEELADLATHKKETMVSFDSVSNLNKKENAEKKLLRTEQVYIIEGWIKKSESLLLKRKIENKFAEAELFVSEPSLKDIVPVILENKRFLQPFELITKIYGMPAYSEVDPTPFLAPFFFIFFGFCITDAAYGIILVLFSLFVLKKFRLGWMGNRFFRLLLYGGVSTIILGALTGGWFGNLIDILAEKNNVFVALKTLKDSITLLDPIKEPMKLLIIALSLGLIQIFFGHIVAIYGNIKNRRYLDIVFDQVSMLVFLFGFTGLILIVLNVLPKQMSNMFTISISIGAVVILLTAGRKNPTLGAKLFSGVFVLYNAFSGYISDILSYSRLWALGLVTSVMATTCNLMAIIIGGTIPFVGFLIGFLILIGGHFFSLVMNLLGAFIHPLRLQFVEFFPKFFKGGGRDFKPLCLENRYTVVE